jgi:hypothetical protein
MQGIRYEREEKGAAGRKKTIVTTTIHCWSCGSFVRSAEHEQSGRTTKPASTSSGSEVYRVRSCQAVEKLHLGEAISLNA